jgi:2-aminoadipate transaminase
MPGPIAPPADPTTRSALRPHLARRAARVRSSEIRDLLRVAERPGVLSLAGGLPAADSIPTARVQAALDRVLDARGTTGPTALQYGPTEGLDELRALVAPGTAGSPALAADHQVLVTTGSQQGLGLVVRALVDPGATVVVEDPLYLGTRQVLEGCGARLRPVPVDAAGLDVDRLASELAGGLRPALVVVVPNHSNPSGAVLAPARRHELGRLAAHYGFVVLEDDPYHGLGFDGPAPPPIAHHAPDHTVTLGSASKMVAPGLRVGWLGAPRWLAPALVLLKQTLDLHTSTLDQLVVADVLRDPTFLDEHLGVVRARNAVRARALCRALEGVVTAEPPRGGMFCWATAAVPTRPALAAAVDAGVAFVPGDAFTVDRDGTRTLRLSFATLEPADLERAAARLARVLRAR